MPTLHVCLLEDSPTALVTPLIDPAIASDRLVIVAAAALQPKAEQLIRLAKTRGFQADVHTLPETDKTGPIKDFFLTLFDTLCTPDNTVWLNASAGKRHHVLAAYEVARVYDCPVFVVEPRQDELYWLYPENAAPTPIQDRLRLHEYFSLYDARYHLEEDAQPDTKELRALISNWAEDIEQCQHALRRLNYLASQARDSLRAPLDARSAEDSTLASMLWELDSVGLARKTNGEVEFTSEQARFFCNGGWLEQHVANVVHRLGSKVSTLQDSAHNARITRNIQGKSLHNELDVVALVNNRLHIIECKTALMAELNTSNALYKLDSLNELLGGLEGRTALVTYFAVSDAGRLRAAELGIQIFGPREIPQLQHHLGQWLQQA